MTLAPNTVRRVTRAIAILAAATLAVSLLPDARTAMATLPALDTTIVPRQGLDWGRLLPGAASRVEPTDAAHRGEIDLIGQGNNTVVVRVPGELTMLLGNVRLPLNFRTGDLILQYTRNGGVSFPNPNLPFDVDPNPGRGDARLLIGGTATPSATQPSGVYVGLITVVFSATAL